MSETKKLDATSPPVVSTNAKEKIYFSVASALLRELGERLVGRPHIALAELIKNSYDADAKKVVVRFRSDGIEIVDNGHGMTLDEFRGYWMRIGSPHKQKQRFSKKLRRSMTGSKGVGRLAVQFLARMLELRTISKESPGDELIATVNWEQAVEAGDLQQASAEYEKSEPVTPYPDNAGHGTALILTGLNQGWPPSSLVNLAREVWWLQPPFGGGSASSEAKDTLVVQLEGVDADAVKKFDFQMRAYLDIWQARLVGKVVRTPGESGAVVQLALEFADRSVVKREYDVPDESLHSAEFEIRIYNLQHRQPHGISVADAREYLNKFGGVHVYDAGFHLPYYGPETDWLKTEIDHSHRLSTSQLLPEELQVERGMNYLPTLSRILGIVRVDTALEREVAREQGPEATRDSLQIQVTRDRLVDNRGYQALRDIVRYSLDFYAMQEAKRAIADLETRRDVEPAHEKLQRIRELIESQSENLSAPAYRELRATVTEVLELDQIETESVGRQAGLLGSLATAGITALAFEHEISQQFGILDEVLKSLRSVRVQGPAQLARIADRIAGFLARARATRALFSHLLDQESREERTRYKARMLIADIVARVKILVKEPEPETSELEETLRLPKGTLAEWSAVFQNVLFNAANAMIDSRKKVLRISSRRDSTSRAILVQDTGVGVDLSTSEELFKPFVRRLKISKERRALGLGGTGLGLTIVRMIAQNLGCRVRFITPDKGFKTALELSWSERE